MTKITRPLPTITADNEEFWASTKKHAMELQRCNVCGNFWYYPGPVCHHCGAQDWTWTALGSVVETSQKDVVPPETAVVAKEGWFSES